MASLGQIEKRLEIIKIAITITDQETIDLQRLKLRRHRDNKQLVAILKVIDDANYAQASQLIERYLGESTYTQETKIKKEISKETLMRVAKDREEEELIKKFGLFREPGRRESTISLTNEGETDLMPSQESVEIVFSDTQLDSMKTKQDNKPPHAQHLTTEEIIAQYDTILTENIPEKVVIPTRIKDSHAEKNEEYKECDTNVEEIDIDEIDIEEYEVEEFKIEPDLYTEPTKKKETIQNDIEAFDRKFHQDIEEQFEHTDTRHTDEHNINEDKGEILHEESSEEPDTTNDEDKEYKESVYIEDNIEYEAISYIDQKVRNMLNQYPQVVENVECFDSEEQLLHKISLDGYSEQDIRDTIEHIYRLADENKLDEASHLLLIVASTESLYAQFILARELYKGRILQKDVAEAFTQINQLAQDQYPEAICDLAQFYEYGIGTSKNKKKAFRLYEDAYDLGVDRADKHLTRMEEESKGILAKLFSKKS